MHLAYILVFILFLIILVFILFLIIFFFLWFPPYTWAGVSFWHTSSQGLQNLQTARRACCFQEVGCWSSKVMDAEAPAQMEWSFLSALEEKRSRKRTEMFCNSESLPHPKFLWMFYQIWCLCGTLGHSGLASSMVVFCPREKSPRFLDPFMSSFETELWID